MELLYDIVKKLRNNEIRNIRNLFRTSPFEFEKVEKLFDLITQFKDKEEAFFSKKLYKKEPDNTFRVTKSRLKKILEDSVLSEKSLSGYSAESINSMLQSRKRLLQGEILLGRGAYLAGKNLLVQVSAIARKYSLHHEEFQSEMMQYRAQSIHSQVKEFEKHGLQLLELNRIQNLVNESAILYYSLSNFLTHQTTEDKKIIAGLRAKLKRIASIHEEVKSPHTAYYYLYSNVLFNQYAMNFDAALEFGQQYLSLLQNEPALHSKQKIAGAYHQLAEITLRVGNLAEAQSFIEETLAFYQKEDTNYLITLDTAFRIAFHSQNWEKAENILAEAMNHPRLLASKLRAGTWHFFKASFLFSQKRFKEAANQLNDATSLLGDKSGWNISFRLLEIMIYYETGKFDLLDSRIINMRQFLKRTQKNSGLFRSMQLIAILMDWYNTSLNLKKGWAAIEPKLKELSEFHKKHPFDANSSELIRFDEWLVEKAGKK